MTSLIPYTLSMSRFYWLGFLSLAVCLFMVAANDSLRLLTISESDFLYLFYVSGHLLRAGLGGNLYPPIGGRNYEQYPFNDFAHQILPGVNHFLPALYLYPPPVAILFVPFSYLPPRESMILWHFLSFVSLYLAGGIITGSWKRGWLAFLSAFTLLPMVHLLLIGQPTIIFAFLPLVAGYAFWKGGKNFLAGCTWSFLWCKAQLLVPLIIMIPIWILSEWVNRRKGEENRLREAMVLAAGVLAGTALLALLSTIFVSPDSVVRWLSCVLTYAQVFTTAEREVGLLFAGTLPAALNLLYPAPPGGGLYMIVVKGILIIIALLLAVLVYRIMQSKQDFSVKQDTVLIITYASLPAISIYLRNYDLAMWFFLLWIYLFKLEAGPIKSALKLFIVVSWVVLDVYFIIWTWSPIAKEFLVFTLFTVVLSYARLYYKIWTAIGQSNAVGIEPNAPDVQSS